MFTVAVRREKGEEQKLMIELVQMRLLKFSQPQGITGASDVYGRHQRDCRLRNNRSGYITLKLNIGYTDLLSKRLIYIF